MENLICEATLGCTSDCTEQALASNRCFLQGSVSCSQKPRVPHSRAQVTAGRLSHEAQPRTARQHGGARAGLSLRTLGSDVTRQVYCVERAEPQAEVTQYWCDWAGARRRLLCGGARWRFLEPPLLSPSRTVSRPGLVGVGCVYRTSVVSSRPPGRDGSGPERLRAAVGGSEACRREGMAECYCGVLQVARLPLSEGAERGLLLVAAFL